MSEINTFRAPVDFVSLCCLTCGIEFWIPARSYLYRREHGLPVCCPNAHGTIYHAAVPTVESQQIRDLRSQVASLTHQLDQAQATLGKFTDPGSNSEMD